MTSQQSPRFRLGFLTHVQGRDDSASTYRNAQELFVAADELGFDVGWVAQHHTGLGGGGLPSPWVFLAHAAARTTHIRLGTAITILPLEHPVRLAEDISVVDTLSGGRVELGVGSGYGPLEYAAFGADFDRKRELTTDNLQVVRRALSNQDVGAEGFTIQPPPGDFTERIWQGIFSATGATYAAAGGSNLLLNRATYGYDQPTDVIQRPWADAFLSSWSHPHRPRVGLSRFIFPASDKRTALAQIVDGVQQSGKEMAAKGMFPAGLTTEDYLYRFHAFYGHPEQIVQELQSERVLPVATDLIAQFNPAIPSHDSALRALELLATEVAPALGWSRAPASPSTVAREPAAV
jgi:alkanesulfonate monooxygenase SsuD/methylene tetrahydromethanopterin reductase-like flavin-dependent oxidoreductase (luciferase family)